MAVFAACSPQKKTKSLFKVSNPFSGHVFHFKRNTRRLTATPQKVTNITRTMLGGPSFWKRHVTYFLALALAFALLAALGFVWDLIVSDIFLYFFTSTSKASKLMNNNPHQNIKHTTTAGAAFVHQETLVGTLRDSLFSELQARAKASTRSSLHFPSLSIDNFKSFVRAVLKCELLSAVG